MHRYTVVTLDEDDLDCVREARVWAHYAAEFLATHEERDSFLRLLGSTDNGDALTPRRAYRLASALQLIHHTLDRGRRPLFYGTYSEDDAPLVRVMIDSRADAYRRLQHRNIAAIIEDLRDFARSAIDDRPDDERPETARRGGHLLRTTELGDLQYQPRPGTGTFQGLYATT